MSDCTDNTNQKLSAAFPSTTINDSPTGLQINDCAINNPVFDINIMLKAAQNYNKLNESVNRMIGSEVRWFRSIPQQRSRDVIFQEYTLSNVDDTPLCIKVMLTDGNFPDSKYNYDLMGLEYEIPLEIQIDKRYWESIAGHGTAPQKKDIVYFAIPNKLYQVESSFLSRGFMEQETAWKLNLRKYSPESSRREGEALQQTINQYTTSTDEIFGDMQNQDINKIVNDRQNSPFNSTERDKYKILNTGLNIITSQLDIYGIRVAESYYDMKSSTEDIAITYSISDSINKDEDRCLSVWMRPNANINKEYSVNYILPILIPVEANFEIVSTGVKFNIGDVVSIYRQGAINLYATCLDDNLFYIEPTILRYLESIRIDWYNLKNFKIKLETPINLLHGINVVGTTGISLDVYSNQFIKFVFSNQHYVAILPEKLQNGDWHGFILNVGNSWGQFNLYIWKQQDIDSITKLYNLYYETLRVSSGEISISNYHIFKSNSDITNIRWYNATLEEEKQVNELLSYFIKDGDKSIINDLADPRYKSPYIAKQR